MKTLTDLDNEFLNQMAKEYQDIHSDILKDIERSIINQDEIYWESVGADAWDDVTIDKLRIGIYHGLTGAIGIEVFNSSIRYLYKVHLYRRQL